MGRLIRIVLIAAAGYVAARILGGARGEAEGRDEPPPRREAECPYGVLGVRRGASRAEVRAAWIALVKQNHPDRVAHQGAAAVAAAEERTRRINAAYERLKRGGG